MQVHIFQFDEELKALRGYGTHIDLLPIYNPGVSITHTYFIHGSEEIVFIDDSAQARIFSLITLQPKYAIFLSFLVHIDALFQTYFSTTTAEPTRDLLFPRRIMPSSCPRRRWRAYNNSLSLVDIRVHLRNSHYTP